MKYMFLAVVITLSSALSAEDAFTISNEIMSDSKEKLLNEDFKALNKLSQIYVDERSRLPDGRWKITFLSYLGDLRDENPKAEFGRKLNIVNRWIKKFPNEPLSYITKADLWLSYASVARGEGYAHTVPKENWPIFYERVSQARKILEECENICKNHPLWYTSMIVIAKLQSWNESELQDIYYDGIKKFPNYYFIHFYAADYFLPRWQGSQKKLSAFVQNALDTSEYEEGMTLYTRIYWYLKWALGLKTFHSGNADWKKMKLGFERIMKDYPESTWNLNAFAYYACLAKDWSTFKELFAKIDEPKMAIWDGDYMIQACKDSRGIRVAY